MSLTLWIAALKKDLGEYGFFQATQILDLHGTWMKGTSVPEVTFLMTELCPAAFVEEQK